MTALKKLIRSVLPVVFVVFSYTRPLLAEETGVEAEAAEAEGQGGHGAHGGLNLFDFSNEEAAPLVALLFNFTALVVIVYLLMKKPLSHRFKDRKDTLVKALEEAKKAKAAADAAIAEARAKMEAVDKEMDAVRKNIIAAAEKEAERLTAAAETRAARLAEDAKMLATQEVTRMAESVRRDVVERITTLAADIIREKITGADQDNLSSKYLADLGTEAQGRADGK